MSNTTSYQACPCGVVSNWDDFKPVGIQYIDGEPSLDMRNCPCCGSTVSREIEPTPPTRGEGNYSEFVDEEKPELGVVVRARDGSVRMLVPLDIWERLRNESLNKFYP